MHSITNFLAAAATVSGVAAQEFNILQHLGGNGQWFPGI
jgi:acid phosphatase